MALFSKNVKQPNKPKKKNVYKTFSNGPVVAFTTDRLYEAFILFLLLYDSLTVSLTLTY